MKGMKTFAPLLAYPFGGGGALLLIGFADGRRDALYTGIVFILVGVAFCILAIKYDNE